MALILKLLFITFFLNLLYELLHSLLYTTCLEARLPKYVYLILKAAIFDAFAIAIIYYMTQGSIILFAVFCIMFAYFWEWYSLKKKKWEYSSSMPVILGVGMTPLFQLALTGLASLYFVINF